MVAPMVGLTHAAFRHLLRHFTPKGLDPLLFTEMLSTRRLPFERLDRVDELRTLPGETHFIPQLLGNEESYIAASIKKLMPLQPWGFDINMGCPAKQTLKHNWGVRLLGDAAYAARVVSMTKRHSPVPVSVKMRCGQEKADFSFLDDFTSHLEEAGADWLTIHARTQTQKHKGEANWEMISSLAPKRRIPLVVNGDIQTADDAVTILRDLAVDGVMIGRAATARPWILWQIASRLGYSEAPLGMEGYKPPEGPEEEGRAFLQSILVFIDFLHRYFEDDDKKLRRLRFHVINAHKWFFFGHAYYSRCMKAKSLDEVRSMTIESLERYHFPMSGRINLI
jgi:tRNA-dihydrouridine synthase